MERVTGRGRPSTTVRITDDGRRRFLSYIDELESVVRDVHQRSGEAANERWAAQS
jgi:predicted ArsR family transcriptional regulator